MSDQSVMDVCVDRTGQDRDDSDGIVRWIELSISHCSSVLSFS